MPGRPRSILPYEMSLDPSLLIRRWPERRPVVLGAAAIGLVAVFAAARAADDPRAAIGLLSLLPIILAALELGLAGGLGAAVLALAVVVAADAGGSEQLDAVGVVTRALAFAAAGIIAGRFSDRMRATHARERRLLGSGLALANAHGIDGVAPVLASAAARVPGAVGAEVDLEGATGAHVGREGARRTVVEIAAGGASLGRLAVAHDDRLAREDGAALELLAMQAGLAADNQRLLAHQRDAAMLEQELLRVRDDLLEQRSGLARLLEVEEDERGRAAERLREDLAQMLAAVLLGLRTLRRAGGDASGVSVDELHQQVVGVLHDVRDVAGTLQPPALAHLGLVPALETLAQELRHAGGPRLEITAGGDPERLDGAIRTALYRTVEHLVIAAPAEGLAQVRVTPLPDSVEISLVLPFDQPVDSVRGAMARVAMLDGRLDVRPSIDDLTRIHIHVPLGRDAQAGNSTRTTVPESSDSMPS